MEMKEINKIAETAAEKAAKKAIEGMRREQQKKKNKKAYSLTFRYLKQYGNLISCASGQIPDQDPEKNEFLETYKKAKETTGIILGIINAAVQELQQETEKSKYAVFEMYFFKNMTYEQILEEMPMGDSTPRRWISEMVTALSIKIFGTEAI